MKDKRFIYGWLLLFSILLTGCREQEIDNTPISPLSHQASVSFRISYSNLLPQGNTRNGYPHENELPDLTNANKVIKVMILFYKKNQDNHYELAYTWTPAINNDTHDLSFQGTDLNTQSEKHIGNNEKAWFTTQYYSIKKADYKAVAVLNPSQYLSDYLKKNENKDLDKLYKGNTNQYPAVAQYSRYKIDGNFFDKYVNSYDNLEEHFIMASPNKPAVNDYRNKDSYVTMTNAFGPQEITTARLEELSNQQEPIEIEVERIMAVGKLSFNTANGSAEGVELPNGEKINQNYKVSWCITNIRPSFFYLRVGMSEPSTSEADTPPYPQCPLLEEKSTSHIFELQKENDKYSNLSPWKEGNDVEVTQNDGNWQYIVENTMPQSNQQWYQTTMFKIKVEYIGKQPPSYASNKAMNKYHIPTPENPNRYVFYYYIPIQHHDIDNNFIPDNHQPQRYGVVRNNAYHVIVQGFESWGYSPSDLNIAWRKDKDSDNRAYSEDVKNVEAPAPAWGNFKMQQRHDDNEYGNIRFHFVVPERWDVSTPIKIEETE